MKIVQYYFSGEADFFSGLRRTPLKGFDQPRIYKNANLQILEKFPVSLLTPPQRYVLKGTVQTIIDLAEAFESNNVDIFQLRSVLYFWTDGMNPERDLPIPFLPPIVEESLEPDNRTVMLVNDGMHRVYSARKMGRSPNILFASGLPREYPYYAYALQGGWGEVEEIAELTDGYKKKEYRNPDNYKALFRQFNVVFPGVQEARKQTQSYLKE